MREKLIQEAPESTPSDFVHLPLDDEFGIMVENLGSNDDENLFTKIKAFIASSQEKTNNSTKSDGDISEGENTYLELEEHDLEEE
ncbi:hypothetical protein D8674_006227 [Pyrus ussuriensis x Pyrus communis]|uniref:Uncharacterized protein n=1 Tax=Pyrus ussuriensis x Pyrus communis TaxID=2448454 RepID=A0A5N5FYP6_9ROSA|nr:hypothetical protein D8674_006227 [Pyrus ussuriensis x Pyrus communis]